MSEAPAAPVTDTPRGPISIDQAVAIANANDEAAAKATPSPDADDQVVAQAETDTPETAPDDAEGGVPEQDEDSPQDDAQEGEDEAGPEGDYVKTEDGEKIPVAELLNSHKRVKDLQARVTRKEQALAEERRTLETSRKEVTETLTARVREAEEAKSAAIAARDQWQSQVQKLGAQLEQQRNAWSQFDWQGLQAQIDAAEASGDEFEANKAWRRFNAARVKYDQHREAEQAVRDELAKVAREQEAEKADRTAKETAAQKAQREAAEAGIREHVITKYPELLDPVKGKKLGQDITDAARELGYTDAEIANTFDPRGFDLLYGFTQWQLLMREKASVTQRKADGTPAAPAGVRIVKGNAPRPRPMTVEKGRLGGTTAQFNKSLSLMDAVAVANARDALPRR